MHERLITRKAQLLLLLATFGLCAQSHAAEPVRLTFGLHSKESPSIVVSQYMPTLKILETSMSEKLRYKVDIRMQIAPDQTTSQQNLINGDVDFSSLNATTYLDTKQEHPDIRIVAAKNSKNTYSLSPWVARPGLKNSVFIALQASLLEIRNTKALTSLEAYGFVESHDSQFSIYSLTSRISRVTPMSIIKYATPTHASSMHRLRSMEPALLAAEREDNSGR